jgi:penicillin-binding protein 2
LSIDIDLQIATEHALENKLGSAVILDVHSGEVLAMASKPDYDVNLLSPRIIPKVYKKITDRGAWLNCAFQGVYPPASAFTIISTIAFSRHNITSWDQIDHILCSGKTKIGTHTFNCDNRTAHSTVSLQSAIEKVIMFIFTFEAKIVVAKKLPKKQSIFISIKKTNIELPFETNRMTIPSSAWKEKKVTANGFPVIRQTHPSARATYSFHRFKWPVL